MKKRNNLFFITIFFAISSFYAIAQESDLIKMYREFPDELYQLKNQSDSTSSIFSEKIRTCYLQDKYYDSIAGQYAANMFRDIDGYYDMSQMEKDSAYQDYSADFGTNYSLRINADFGWVNYAYFYKGNRRTLDFIYVINPTCKYVILFEQMIPGMGVPNRQKYTLYTLDENNLVVNSKELEFPEFNWNNFYSEEDIEEIKMDIIGDFKIPYVLEVKVVSEELSICLTPDIDVLAWRMSEVLDFGDEYLVGQAYYDSFERLGIDNLPDAKPLCIPMHSFLVFD